MISVPCVPSSENKRNSKTGYVKTSVPSQGFFVAQLALLLVIPLNREAIGPIGIYSRCATGGSTSRL